MKRKVGILTFQYPENRNFGASLQSYACMKLLKKFTENVELINYYRDVYSIKSKLVFLLEGRNFKKYNEKFLSLTKKIKKEDKLEFLNKKFDIFVVGSDQVWRSIWFKDVAKHYFFDFVDDNKKKIAYAASFGVDFWEGDKNITGEIKPLIKKFDYISVREESGVNICKDIFEIDDAICVLDPTLMISKEDYQPVLDDWKDKSHLNKKYIAHMLLDDEIFLREESKKIANYLGAQINYIRGKTIRILGKNLTLYNKVS